MPGFDATGDRELGGVYGIRSVSGVAGRRAS